MYTYSIWETLLIILNYAGRTLLELSPYVLAGVVLGEILKLASWTKLAYAWISRSPGISLLFASVLGMASPLCTYGTVPVVLQLFRAGVHPAPLATFLAVSSMMNPQLFIYTWGWLGPGLALFRIGSILVFGLLLGGCLYRLPASLIVNRSALSCDETGEEIQNRRGKVFQIRRFRGDVLGSLQHVGFYMVLGILAGAVLDVAVPDYWLDRILRPNNLLSVLLSTLAGIPLYACGGGALPVVRQLMQSGMGRGAALAFLFVGPATRITPLMALAAVLRPLFIVIYVMAVLAFAFSIGLVFK